jgi:hypothetical protein
VPSLSKWASALQEPAERGGKTAVHKNIKYIKFNNKQLHTNVSRKESHLQTRYILFSVARKFGKHCFNIHLAHKNLGLPGNS